MAADQGDLTYQDPNRRDFIHIAAGAAAVGAGAMAVWPLVNSMNPAADTRALSTIELTSGHTAMAPAPTAAAPAAMWMKSLRLGS